MLEATIKVLGLVQVLFREVGWEVVPFPPEKKKKNVRKIGEKLQAPCCYMIVIFCLGMGMFRSRFASCGDNEFS